MPDMKERERNTTLSQQTKLNNLLYLMAEQEKIINYKLIKLKTL